MSENPLVKLGGLGQSVWVDFLDRKFVSDGQLRKLVEEDGVRGLTSNPKIFADAIEGSPDYDVDFAALAEFSNSVPQIIRALSISDIQDAADILRPVYDRSEGGDGFVSLEVNPNLARDTQATIAEARELWQRINRPNAFVKIPATAEGIPAIRECLAEGININVTLIFGLARYQEVAEAYISALERRAVQGLPIDRLTSVASFFLSRIDAMVDPMLERIVKESNAKGERAKELIGQVAIASAKKAYQVSKGLYSTNRFVQLATKGARPQRLLWASTSTKNPNYSDTKYVEALVAPYTINTMPLETLNAYRDHGDPAVRIEEELDRVQQVFDSLAELGIDIEDIAQKLENEGVKKFGEPYDKLVQTLEKKRSTALQPARG